METKRKVHQEIDKNHVFNTIEWQNNITTLDLSNRGIHKFDENVMLPSCLLVLNLSKNKFIEVPRIILKLENLKTLDISHNDIVLFDETPNFCHTVECLNLENNKLEGPPSWVWCEQPRNLMELNLSNNINICCCFDNYHIMEELKQHTTLVKTIDLHCCRLFKYIELIKTFKHAKIIILGDKDYNYHSVNHIESVPCIGLEDCRDVEVLDLCNTHIYNVLHNIDIYQNLLEINLAQNNINGLPNEFCNLKHLQVCILSHNKILYLPDDLYKLSKLIKLYIDSNELCMLPDKLDEIAELRILDLYNNHLYEGLEDISNLEQYDFAQNYGDEPDDQIYILKKEKLRQNISRLDGRAPEIILVENESHYESDYESFIDDGNDDNISESQKFDNRCSSTEDWDSDNCWIPSTMDIGSRATSFHKSENLNLPTSAHWLNFVKRKMNEGNFCPVDMHLTISITDKVKYEKMCNPQPIYESDGQFDDYSDDET